MMARLVSRQLAERWNVPIIIENRPGNGGQICADVVAKATPDGNTLLTIMLTHAANVTLFAKAPFNVTRDLRPVALMAGSPMLVVVPTDSPILNFADLVAAARTKKLNAVQGHPGERSDRKQPEQS